MWTYHLTKTKTCNKTDPSYRQMITFKTWSWAPTGARRQDEMTDRHLQNELDLDYRLHPEEWGSKILRNVGTLRLGYTASHPRPLHPEDEGSKVLWKVGIVPQDYTMSQQRRPLHPEDGGSKVIRKVNILPKVTLRHNTHDLDLYLGTGR
jgi:hypothetical protein